MPLAKSIRLFQVLRHSILFVVIAMIFSGCGNDMENNIQEMFDGQPATTDQIIGVWTDHDVFSTIPNDWRDFPFSGHFWVFREDNTAGYFLKETSPNTGKACWDQWLQGTYIEQSIFGDYLLFEKPKRIELNDGFLVMEDNPQSTTVGQLGRYLASRSNLTESDISPLCQTGN